MQETLAVDPLGREDEQTNDARLHEGQEAARHWEIPRREWAAVPTAGRGLQDAYLPEMRGYPDADPVAGRGTVRSVQSVRCDRVAVPGRMAMCLGRLRTS